MLYLAVPALIDWIVLSSRLVLLKGAIDRSADGVNLRTQICRYVRAAAHWFCVARLLLMLVVLVVVVVFARAGRVSFCMPSN